MTKERVQGLVVSLVVVASVASALGYLLAPSAMLRIVGIQGDRTVDLLVRTLAAALLALPPGAWAARRRDATPSQRAVLVGLAAYLFASSWSTSTPSPTASSAPPRCRVSPSAWCSAP
jgi:hypothetical protein